MSRQFSARSGSNILFCRVELDPPYLITGPIILASKAALVDRDPPDGSSSRFKFISELNSIHLSLKYFGRVDLDPPK